LHPFNVTEPAQSLCSDEVYYVLTFYYFIQLLVTFYSPYAIFIVWAEYTCILLVYPNTGVLISPQPDLLHDLFCLMVRIFRLMLVLLYIYI